MRKSRRSSRPHKKKHNNIKKYHEAYSLRFDDRILLANEQSPSTRMHSTQKIDSSAFTGSRLSTHRSSGKTASISKKIRATPNASLPAAAETILARETRQEETTSTTRNKVASRFYLQRERDLSFEQIRRQRVRFFGRVSRLLVRFRAQWFIFSLSSNKPPHFICFRFV